MQGQSEKKNSGRFGTFFKSARGQIFVTCCAYSALSCTIIGFLLSDYTRLAWPFVIASFFLAMLGQAAYSHKRFAQVVLLLWVIQANSIGAAVFNLGNQTSQVECLREQRGPTWLIRMAAVFHELVWWIYATSLYIALSTCSTMFFRGAPYTYPPLFISIGLGGLIAALILQMAEIIIVHTTTKSKTSQKNAVYNAVVMRMEH